MAAVAIDVTPSYLQHRLAGEKGVTWRSSLMPPRSRRPIFDRVIRHSGAIELSATCSSRGSIRAPYRLREDGTLIHLDGNRFVEPNQEVGAVAGALTGLITVRRRKVGFDPGEAYMTNGYTVFEAEYDHIGPVPTPDLVPPVFAWSITESRLSDRYHAMRTVTPALCEIIEVMQQHTAEA